MRTAWAVSFEPAPATSIARPATASPTSRSKVCFSGRWVVGASPVVPASRIMFAPSSTRLTARAWAASTSIDPSWWKGVTIATPTDPKGRESGVLID